MTGAGCNGRARDVHAARAAVCRSLQIDPKPVVLFEPLVVVLVPVGAVLAKLVDEEL